MKNYSIALNRDLTKNNAVNAALGVIFFVLATAFSAYVRIPVPGTPIPITLQTLFVMLSGAVLGRRLGSFSQFSYLIIGALGIPVFQGSSFGLAHIAGPTGGYLLGFIFAAYLIGRILEGRDFGIYRATASFIIGSIALYACGVTWLMYLYRINVVNALSIGVLPFIPGEAIKIFFAVAMCSVISKRSKEIFSA